MVPCPHCHKDILEDPEVAHGLREKLSDTQHSIWSHWMMYLFSKSHYINPQSTVGSMLIPGNFIKHWRRQTLTPYSDLDDIEKNSDREQADKTINAMSSYFTSLPEDKPDHPAAIVALTPEFVKPKRSRSKIGQS